MFTIDEYSQGMMNFNNETDHTFSEECKDTKTTALQICLRFCLVHSRNKGDREAVNLPIYPVGEGGGGGGKQAFVSHPPHPPNNLLQV